jgi:hypothetical protein
MNPDIFHKDALPANRWYLPSTEWLCGLLVVVAAALAMSPNVADPDLWGHVQFGRDVLSDGQIAATTTYSYTADGYRWINHENLSEIVMAFVADRGGPLGLVFGKFLLSLLVILAVLGTSLRQGQGLVVASIMTLLVAANLGYHWSIRPQLSSFVCFTLLMLLLQFCFAGWSGRWHWKWPQATGEQPSMQKRLGYRPVQLKCLWLLVPLFLVWANAHGGFVAGLAVVWAYLGLRAGEAFCQGGGWTAGNAGWGLVRRMGLMAAAATLATFVNPYGPGLQLWLLESLGSPRPEISDWSSSPLFTIVGLKLWLLVAVSLFAVLASRQPRDATQVLVLVLLLWQSLTHFRHVPFFAIAAGFWVGPHLKSALDRFATASQPQVPGHGLQLAIRAGLVLLLLAAGGTLRHRLGDLQVRRDTFPVDAVDFMRTRGLHGNLVVTYDWAQYAIAALCSNDYATDCGCLSRVAFDGRFRTCYPQQIVDMHFDFLYGDSPRMPRHRHPDSPPVDPFRVLQHGAPDLVLLRRTGELTEQHMYQQMDHWVLLYQDAIAQVWGRRSTYDNPQHPAWLPLKDRVVHNRRATDSVTWPAIQRSRPANRLISAPFPCFYFQACNP